MVTMLSKSCSWLTLFHQSLLSTADNSDLKNELKNATKLSYRDNQATLVNYSNELH